MGNINSPHKINYIPRKIKIDSFITESDKITNINVNITLPELTLTELIMIRYYIRNHTDETIAKKLNISLTTLRFHKYHVMLKLKLKRMHHIIYTEHYNYIMG
ncbi:helix-turn-helix transcriptional regulator [Citrobacter meridianamericanus]|uniref:helix-turn-helix transcriptional regulator n=1 Tax=Citrobacter meridianamericanus TaxID=2894201 RepID=UPI003B8A948C